MQPSITVIDSLFNLQEYILLGGNLSDLIGKRFNARVTTELTGKQVDFIIIDELHYPEPPRKWSRHRFNRRYVRLSERN